MSLLKDDITSLARIIAKLEEEKDKKLEAVRLVYTMSEDTDSRPVALAILVSVFEILKIIFRNNIFQPVVLKSLFRNP